MRDSLNRILSTARLYRMTSLRQMVTIPVIAMIVVLLSLFVAVEAQDLELPPMLEPGAISNGPGFHVDLPSRSASTSSNNLSTPSEGYPDLTIGMDSYESIIPTTEFGPDTFFTQELGTMFRVQYSTESYGQDQRGNLDLGSMQVFNYEDAISFIDGQATLNDVQGVGFNVGFGYRWLSESRFFPLEPMRITGVSVWGDGTSTKANNFFPQLGVSFESLGDLWDFRANGYIPLGPRHREGDFTTGFLGSNTPTFDTSYNVAEIEVARRIANRDLWGFAGGYSLSNGSEETGGYRVGFRGYALPDLLVQMAFTEDDIFDTKATFSLIWFVGRTRTNYHSTCDLPDRFREPVMRNDYVALGKDILDGM